MRKCGNCRNRFRDGADVCIGYEMAVTEYLEAEGAAFLRAQVVAFFQNEGTFEDIALKFGNEDNTFREDYVSWSAGSGGAVYYFVLEEMIPEGIPRVDVETVLGTLRVEEGGDVDYPGIWISLLRSGREEVLALAEVPDEEGTFCLRPYVSSSECDRDEDGCLVKGHISDNAPMGCIRVPETAFLDRDRTEG